MGTSKAARLAELADAPEGHSSGYAYAEDSGQHYYAEDEEGDSEGVADGDGPGGDRAFQHGGAPRRAEKPEAKPEGSTPGTVASKAFAGVQHIIDALAADENSAGLVALKSALEEASPHGASEDAANAPEATGDEYAEEHKSEEA